MRHMAKRVAGASLLSLAVAISGLGAPSLTQAHSVSKSGVGAPCIPAGHGPGTIPSISFGRTGGNIRPLTVLIYGDGTITYQGSAQGLPAYSIRPVAVQGLERLAQAEGFATWPAKIKSPRFFPDAATLFVTIRAGCSTTTKTVKLLPGANQPQFIELWSTLTAASGLGNQ
ncbi:MAG: hypothetical protein JWO42_4148 [Chloroflexi bacterium]|nr:hypothetical protein [Chloroflexota bacterium]